ncbi:MAG: threonylcarbamoyl-AMP synthase [Gemmatimonadetes bacterium]|nr:threonylcarbamoyl-AMP synthase [Gemmatimonadota bacterium]
MTHPRLIPFTGAEWRARYLDGIVRHLRDEGLIAYPTETVYGLGSTLTATAVARLRALKARAPEKTFLVLVTDRGMVEDLVWSPDAGRLAEALWPGPLTLVLPAPTADYPPGVRDARGTVAVRATPHPELRVLLTELGEPLTSTSANTPGRSPARSAAEAAAVVASLGGTSEVWVLDGGRLPPSQPSTILDCTVEPPVIARLGALPAARIRAIIPRIDEPAQRRQS